MSGTYSDALFLIGAVLGGWVIPALGMRLVLPALESSAWHVKNYRGRSVFVGLGIVWVFWGVALAFLWLATSPAASASLAPSWVVPILLVLLAFVFGFVDDVFGGTSERGFRGHLRAMMSGRLTTGGLKVVGIGAASLWAALATVKLTDASSGLATLEHAIGVVAGTVLVAGSANLLNLLDLRPGRALKGYLGLFAIAFAFLCAATDWNGAPFAVAARLLAVAILFVGPALAVWPYDLAERGMLGDAGANAAGAFAGYALLVWLPLWGMIVAAVLVVGLNLASERVSFSQVIDGHRVLAWLDGLGRLRSEEPPHEYSA